MRIYAQVLLVLFVVALAAPAHAVQIERVVSPGGVEAWLVREDAVPVIVMNVAWRGGSANDPADKAGLANMVSGLLDEGAGDLDARAFRARMDAIAMQMSFSADRDHFTANFKTLAEKRNEAFSLFSLAITSPRFDEEAIERVRAQINTIISQNMENPRWLASSNWFRAAFGEHPYGRSSMGTHATVKRIGHEDLANFTKRILARDNMKISVVGPLSPEDLGVLLDRTFGGLPANVQRTEIINVVPTAKARTIVVQYDNPQSLAIFGMQGLPRHDPDFIPAFVMNYILGGGGFSSRLTEEVREKRGLAYSVSSFLFPLRHAALYMGSVGTQNERMGLSLKLIRTELARMAEGGVTEAELADAKTFLVGSYPLRFSSNASIASELLGIQTEELGIDYVDRRNAMVEAVTREDIARVARRLLQPDQMIVTVVGKPNLSDTAPMPLPVAKPAPQASSPHGAPPLGH